MNLYSILEIEPNASETEIKKAYFTLSKKYHPDKCNDRDANEKFHRINTAYQILMDEQSRKKYLKMNVKEKSNLHKFLEKIFKDNLKIESLKEMGISITKKDWEQLEINFKTVVNKINFKDVFELLLKGIVPNIKNNNNMSCSDTDVDVYDESHSESYYILPINYQRPNKLDIKINRNITLQELINGNKIKLRIKRQIEDETFQNDFIFSVEKPYIVFNGGGDMDDGDYGNLIIQLVLPQNFYWKENMIIYDYNISVYQLIYGLDINLNVGKNIEYKNWVPSRDGILINVDKITIKNNDFVIKLTLNYEHSFDKELILQNL